MKRLIVAAMAATAMLSFAWADETVDPDLAVARIGDTYFLKVKEAFDVAKSGDTVVLTKNSSAVNQENPMTISDGRILTLDLNGFNFKASSDSYAYNLSNGSQLTLKDSSEAGTGVLEKLAAYGTFGNVESGAKFILESGTIDYPFPDTMNVVRAQNSGLVEINGGQILTIAPGEGKKIYALRSNSGSTVTVNGGRIVGVIDDVSHAGTLTIPADSVALFDRDQTAYCAEGYVTDEHGENEGDLAGWWFVTAGPKVEIAYDYGVGTAPATPNKAAFVAYAADRTFTLAPPTGDAEFAGWTASNAAITFNGNVMTIPADFAEAFTVTATYASLSVAKIGDKTFATLADAFAAAQEGDTVELLGDLTLDAGITITDKNLVLDLGGFTLDGSAVDKMMTIVGTTMDIQNGEISTGPKQILVKSDSTVTVKAGATISMNGTYTFRVEDATLNVYGEFINVASDVPAIQMYTPNGTVNVYEGAHVAAKGDAIRVNFENGKSVLNVYGGLVESTGGYPALYAYKSGNVSVITVTGGTLKSSDPKQGMFNIQCDSVVVTPLDDTCTAKFSSDICGWLGQDNPAGITKLSDVCAAGFEPVKGEDGYYTIQAKAAGWPTEWADIKADDDVKAKFAKWRSEVDPDADLATDAAKDAFLLNVAVDDIKELKIESIDVDAEGYATIVVGAPGMYGFMGIDLGEINGVLYVEAGETLEAMAPKAVAYWTTTRGKAVIKVKEKFIRAAIGFKAPKEAADTVLPSVVEE